MIELSHLDTSNSEEIKACCTNLYESDWAKLLLGDSFHPGGRDAYQPIQRNRREQRRRQGP